LTLKKSHTVIKRLVYKGEGFSPKAPKIPNPKPDVLNSVENWRPFDPLEEMGEVDFLGPGGSSTLNPKP